MVDFLLPMERKSSLDCVCVLGGGGSIELKGRQKQYKNILDSFSLAGGGRGEGKNKQAKQIPIYSGWG